MRYRLIVTIAILVLMVPVITTAASGDDDSILLDFKNVAITDLVKTISEMTGKNFILDDSIKGSVTIISPQKMPKEDAYKIFLSVLKMKGYTVIPAGSTNKVVALRDVRNETLPAKTGSRIGGGEEYVTRLVPLKHIQAEAIAGSVLKSLLPKSAQVIAYGPTNTLIISDTEANIEKLYKVIQALDINDSISDLQIISLEYADADGIAKIVNEVIAASAKAGQRAKKGAQTAGAATVKIIPYQRTNSLLVLSPPEELVLIRSIIDQLDTKTTQERAGIYVYYLENADAETLAQTLNEIMTGVKASAPKGKDGKPAAASNEKVTITSDKSTNSLIVNSTPEDYETIKGIVSKLDIKRKQVFVEALVLELSLGLAQDIGISLQGAAASGSDGVFVGSSNLNYTKAGSAAYPQNIPSSILGSSIEGLMLGGMFNPVSTRGPDGSTITVPAITALLNLSETTSDVNVLSAPRLLTTDNEEAEIIVGQEVPIITERVSDSSSGSSGTVNVNVERKDVALTLRFTPQITEGDLVRLNIFQEITDLAASNVGSIDEVGPTLTKRSLKNTVVAEDNKTIVLGGLISNNQIKSVSKVPLLGDLPLIGWLFRRTVDDERKTTLMIFVTPTIIRSSEDMDKLTQKNRAAFEQSKRPEKESKQTQTIKTTRIDVSEEVISN